MAFGRARSRSGHVSIVSTLAIRAGVILAAIFGHLPARASVAEYTVTFDMTWSAVTHPSAYPPNAHFSAMIGGTHDASTSFWHLGGLASLGIEQMAEGGAKLPLLGEVQQASDAGSAFSQVNAPSGGDSPGVRQASFVVSSTHPEVTVVAMIAPSPDWFVGVDGLALWDGSSWAESVLVSLEACDAGTDDGTDFIAPDQDTTPPEPITAFSGPPFAGTPALGTFAFELVSVTYGCENGLDDDGDGLIDALDPGCEDPMDDTETNDLVECDDGIDNDGDGFADGADPGCSSLVDDSEFGSAACDDGIDNDGDTYTDLTDPGCDDLLDASEHSHLQCDDGQDNDGDGAVDYPADPDCSSPLDVDESSPGLSLLAPPMTALLALAISMTGVAIGHSRWRRDTRLD